MMCMIIGWNWDISWHRTIGRDTLWTLPHTAIYSAVGIAFIYNAALVLSYTFGRLKGTAGIRVLWFAGPAATFIALWSILLQGTGFMFDAWWHDVYGLDVVLFSPPHYALTIAIALFHFAQFVVVATFFNAQSPGAVRARRWLLLLLWSFYIGHCQITDYNWGPWQVRSVLYMVTSAAFIPFGLAMVSEYLEDWTAGAKAALLYFGWNILLMQVFQLFPARAEYGPVFHEIDFMLPPPFPLALFVPALAVGAVLYKVPHRFAVARYLLAGLAFVVSFTAANWGTSALQISDWGNNSIVAGHYPSYVFYAAWRPVTPLTFDGLTLGAGLLSVALAAVSIWAAVAVGRWVRRVIR
jgi:hypothetical protein